MLAVEEKLKEVVVLEAMEDLEATTEEAEEVEPEVVQVMEAVVELVMEPVVVLHDMVVVVEEDQEGLPSVTQDVGEVVVALVQGLLEDMGLEEGRVVELQEVPVLEVV